MMNLIKTLLSKLFRKKEKPVEAVKKKPVSMGSVAIRPTEDSTGVKEYLKNIQRTVVTDNDTGMALALSLIHSIAASNNTASRFSLSCDIIHDGQESVIFTNEVSIVAANIQGGWRILDRKKLPITLADAAIREYQSLMASTGWVSTHDCEKLSTEFLNSAIDACVQDNIERYKAGKYDCSVGVRVKFMTADASISNSQPYIEIGVLQRIQQTVTPAILMLRFHRAA